MYTRYLANICQNVIVKKNLGMFCHRIVLTKAFLKDNDLVLMRLFFPGLILSL
jgi:hypothetical protein